MNPLHRKMFRQPGMSRQPAGILASSPELSNVVRQRMGQPVQMSNGGQTVTDYMSAIRDLAAKGDKATLNNIATDQRLPRSVQMAAANALAGRSGVPDQIQAAPVSDAERMAANRSNLAALRSAQGLGQGADIDTVPSDPLLKVGKVNFGNILSDATGRQPIGQSEGGKERSAALVDAPGKIASGLTSGIEQVFDKLGDLMPKAKGYAPSGPRSSYLTPSGIKDRGKAAMGMTDDPYVNPDGSERLVRDPVTGELGPGTARNIDAAISARLANDDVPTTAAENLANNNAAIPRFVSTVDQNLDPGATAEAEEAARKEIAAGNVDPGEEQGLVGTEGDAPKKNGKKNGKKTTNLDLALELSDSYDEQTEAAKKTVIGATTSENINDVVASAIETQNSNASDKDKADATDAAVGIKGTRKERVKARQALLKELLGEEQAKDIRGDAGYNLMMVGLMMAAGESPNALTNFANAAAKGLQNFATVQGERSEAKRKEDRAIALKALDEVGAEISQEEKRSYENQVRSDSRRHDIDLQERKYVEELKLQDRKYTEAEKARIADYDFKMKMAGRSFKENILLLGIKSDNAQNLQQMQNDFSRELQTLKNQEDSAAIKTAKSIRAANPEMYPTLADAYAATQSSTKSTDEQQRYSRLVASGMPPSQAIIFAQTGVTTEMFKQLGAEEAQEQLGGMMGSGQTAAPATITIADLPETERNKLSKYKPGETVSTKQGNYLVTNAGTLVPVR
tara:strand:- start:1003 stop:3222 length:2220 start_codon:yes stop_codon:yes gene_type:complete